MSLAEVVVVPAAPLLLPAASPGQPAALVDAVAALRRRVRVALAPAVRADTVLLLAGGEDGVLHDRAVAGLRPLGVHEPDVELPVDTDLLAALAARGAYPRGRTDRLDGDLAVLTLLCADAGVTGAVLPMEVPAAAAPEALDAVAAGVRGAADAAAGSVVVVAAGDLSAGLDTSSPAYRIDGAEDFDRRATAALDAGEHGALAALGPDEAARVQARGWAPLVVASALRAGTADGTSVAYSAVRGVGQVVLGP